LAEGEPVEGRTPTLPVEGRAPAVPVEGLAPPVEGLAPPDPQPLASWLRAEFEALGPPLLLRRLWSGCHFFCALVDDARAPLAEVDRALLTFPFRLTFELRLTFLSMSMSTSPW
jgi:hypothetical protein